MIVAFLFFLRLKANEVGESFKACGSRRMRTDGQNPFSNS
jgi:hypothetical protein